jgi:predicted molibdopterin-dependent oxidoreductase YjgC
MSERVSIVIDGSLCDAYVGETVLEAARRADVWIPTLCEDARLEPKGACRLCLVEIDGQAKLQPACTFRVAPNLSVRTRTSSDLVARHLTMLLGLYLADHPVDRYGLPLATVRGNRLRFLVHELGAVLLDRIDSPRRARAGEDNPYIRFDPRLCVLCGRCVRYCDEVAGVSAISLAYRGAETTVSTAAGRRLLDTSCELCGGCVDTCPTGALSERKAPLEPAPDGDRERRVRTTCGYCGVGCQLDLHVVDDRVARITSAPPGETVNDGNLCVKGRFAYDFIHHPDRLTSPLVRASDGGWRTASWEEAIARAADGLRAVADAHGTEALGFVSSSRCTGEENYLLQKLARAAFGTNACHQCAAT